MPLVKRISSAMLFQTGMLAVFDLGGNQVGELQGGYSIDKHKRILLEATDNCEFTGFHQLPVGFHETAKSWASYFRDKQMSFEEIEAL